jgi:hypothetical protein
MLSVVNNFRRPAATENWEANFKTWQEDAEQEEGNEN